MNSLAFSKDKTPQGGLNETKLIRQNNKVWTNTAAVSAARIKIYLKSSIKLEH